MIWTSVFVESLKIHQDGFNALMSQNVVVLDGIILNVVDWPILKIKI